MQLLCKLIGKITEIFTAISCALMAFQVNAGESGYFNPIISTTVQSETMRGVNSPNIEDAHVDLFANNVYHVSQQEGSMLMPFVLVEGMVMNAKQINRLGSLSDPNLYRGRGSKVTATNPPNDNRWLTAQRYWHACFVDNWDQVRTLWDIRNAYSQAMAMSFGRLMDRVIIAAALGTVWAGPQRQTQVALPNSQKIVSKDTSNAHAGANLDLLMRVRTKMKKSFAITKGETIVMVITADESQSLLNESKMTNRDYTTILALMSGEISAFFGIVFVETQLLPTNSEAFTFTAATGQVAATGTSVAAGAANRCFAFVSGSTLCFGINQNMLARVSERPDLHYNIQIYYAAEFGAVRKEEVKVVECLTKTA